MLQRLLILFLITTSPWYLHSCESPKANKYQDLVTQKLDVDAVPINPKSFIAFKQLANQEGYTPQLTTNEFNHLYTLEKMQRVSEIITQKTGFVRATASHSIMLHWLSALLLIAKTSEKAVDLWRTLPDDKQIPEYWQDAKKITELSDEAIVGLHANVKDFERVADTVALPTFIERMYGTGLYTHQFCDEYEVGQAVSSLRCLDALRQHGLHVTFVPQHLETLQKLAPQIHTPLVEALKNRRYIEVSGLKNSKISQVIHDHVDHFLTFDLLERHGIFDRYRSFLSQVGSPDKTDIFSREGELIASVTYDYRFSNLPSFKQIAFFSYDDIKELLKSAQLTSPNQIKAYDILQDRSNDATFIERLPIVICGVYTELMQQRIKNGIIKVIDPKKNKAIDFLHTLNPEYLSLIIEIYDTFDKHKVSKFKELYNVQVMMEAFLQKIASTHNAPLQMNVTGDNVRTYEPTKSGLKPEILTWFKQNLGAISDRNPYK